MLRSQRARDRGASKRHNFFRAGKSLKTVLFARALSFSLCPQALALNIEMTAPDVSQRRPHLCATAKKYHSMWRHNTIILIVEASCSTEVRSYQLKLIMPK
jgi:hypothetical protein